MSRIGILFTIPNFITAGTGRAMLNVVERLDRARFAPAVCVWRKGGALDQVVCEMGIPFLEAQTTISARPLPNLAVRVKRAAAPFKEYGFQVWHSWHYGDDYTEPLIARASGARWVYTKKNMSWNRRSWFLRTVFARRVGAQNTDMMAHFFNSFPLRSRCMLVPAGVDTERFKPSAPRRSQHRTALGLPADALVAACVAHLVPVKGHPTLIDALTHVPGLYLVLAGSDVDHVYAESLRKQVAERGLEKRITFLGDVSDVPRLLSAVDMAVLPTWDRWRREGCPGALLEAMACGLPCIATDIPGSRDIVEDERSGLLVEPQDSAALAGALLRLASDQGLRRRLGEGARNRVLARYTIDREVKDYERLYTEAIYGSNSGPEPRR